MPYQNRRYQRMGRSFPWKRWGASPSSGCQDPDGPSGFSSIATDRRRRSLGREDCRRGGRGARPSPMRPWSSQIPRQPGIDLAGPLEQPRHREARSWEQPPRRGRPELSPVTNRYSRCGAYLHQSLCRSWGRPFIGLPEATQVDPAIQLATRPLCRLSAAGRPDRQYRPAPRELGHLPARPE